MGRSGYPGSDTVAWPRFTKALIERFGVGRPGGSLLDADKVSQAGLTVIWRDRCGGPGNFPIFDVGEIYSLAEEWGERAYEETEALEKALIGLLG